MRIHLPFPRHNRTAFTAIDAGACKACGACIETCPNDVLGFVAVWRHRHVHVDHGCDCVGCRKCIQACKAGAITPIQRSALAAGGKTHSA